MQERYKRQILLDKFGLAGQEALNSSKIGIVGLGGLGAILAEYLTRAGVGSLVIADHDIIELSNLHRQSLYCEQDLEKPKAEVIVEKLHKINSKTKIVSHQLKIDSNNISIFDEVSIVCDACDNFRTRHIVNSYCFDKKKTLASAGVIGYENQISIYYPGQKIRAKNINSPCYACIFPKVSSKESKYPKPNFSPSVLGITAANAALLLAFEVINEIANMTESLAGNLMISSNLTRSSQMVKVIRDPKCQVCGS